jgi:pimeloyl-ACP methyl ester carboxylesterase
MEHGRIDNGNGVELAWQRLAGSGPSVVFLPGFRSDMQGDKATAIATLCAQEGRAMLLFDYAGHGQSDGRFDDGTISAWKSDALAVVDSLTQGPLLLVGSSMGGWIGALVAMARPDRVAGFIGIAAAPDFTEAMMWEAMTFEERAILMERGVVEQPSDYGAPYPITRALIEDGRTQLVLGGPIPITAPVRLLHGQADRDVPWEFSLRLAAQIASTDVQVVLVKDGEHRMSRPQDLDLLRATILSLLKDRA